MFPPCLKLLHPWLHQPMIRLKVAIVKHKSASDVMDSSHLSPPFRHSMTQLALCYARETQHKQYSVHTGQMFFRCTSHCLPRAGFWSYIGALLHNLPQ